MNWSSQSSITVLHVDDDPNFTDLTATFLERADERITVETAQSASAGLDRLAEGVDCVVSDYDMPEMSGIDFLEALRERHPDLPFVLFTGKGSEAVASDAISAGVTDYLQKASGTGQYTVLANRIANAVEQHRSKVALEASEKRLSLFIEQSALGVIEYNEDFEIVGLNPAGQEILGYTEAELQGETWEKLVSQASYEDVDTVTAALVEGTGGFHSVDENVRKDGERIICEWHNRIVTDDDDDVVAVFSQFRDVTERRRREDDLRETTARLEALFEHSPDMIDIHDIEGTILDVNPRLCEVTGYDESELVGMKVWDLDESLCPADARDAWEEMSDGELLKLDGEFRCRDGSQIPVEVHLRRIERDGDPRFVVGSRDVSERVERERRLESATARYRTLLENFPGGVFMFDDDLRYTLAGGDELAVAGLSGEDVIESRPDGLFPSDIATAITERYRDALRGTTHTFEQQYNGRQYRIRTLPVRGDDGAVVAGMAVSRDVTEQKRREQRLRQQRERLEEFASVVSHDLRNPLAVAEGHLELALRDHDDEHLRRVNGAHRRMRVLIDDLLALAHDGAESGTIESISVADVAEAAWSNVETGDATLVVDATRRIEGDRSQCQQLLENLVRNAVEHGGDDVTVTVGTFDDGVYVADDGPGVPESDREKVLEKGFSTAAGGTGFGLYIVAELARRHGWSVRVGESDDGGARFDITGVTRSPGVRSEVSHND